MMRQRQTHQVARVIVQERGHVETFMFPEQEREQIRLPKLVRLGPLEPVRPRLRLGTHLRARRRQPLLLQYPPHRGRRSPQAKVPLQHIADPPATRRRLRLFGRHDR